MDYRWRAELTRDETRKTTGLKKKFEKQKLNNDQSWPARYNDSESIKPLTIIYQSAQREIPVVFKK